MSIPKINLMGINISVVDLPDLLAEIDRLAGMNQPALVNNVNIHACNLACENADFRNVLNSSDVVFCDGFGVKLAAWLTGKRLGQRMTPPDWIDVPFVIKTRRSAPTFGQFRADKANIQIEIIVGGFSTSYPLKVGQQRWGHPPTQINWNAIGELVLHSGQDTLA